MTFCGVVPQASCRRLLAALAGTAAVPDLLSASLQVPRWRRLRESEIEILWSGYGMICILYDMYWLVLYDMIFHFMDHKIDQVRPVIVQKLARAVPIFLLISALCYFWIWLEHQQKKRPHLMVRTFFTYDRDVKWMSHLPPFSHWILAFS